LLEADRSMTVEELKLTPLLKTITAKNKNLLMQVSKVYRQQLTHQTINGLFVHIKLKQSPSLKGYTEVSFKEMAKLPFPRFITGYLTENDLKAFER